jgi:hypothetical protein
VFDKTIIAVTIAVALGCMSVAANAFAADHRSGEPGGRHVLSRHAWGGPASRHALGAHGVRYGSSRGAAPIYDTCDGYHGNGCPGFGVPYVGGLINGVPRGY